MRGGPFLVGPFNGGINIRDAPWEIPLSQSPDCLNVIADKDGVVRKREPCTLVTATFTGAGSNNISTLYSSSSISNTFIVIAGLKIYSVTTAGVVTDITGAATITLNRGWAWIEAPATGGQGPFYGISDDGGGSTPKFWTGAGNVGDWTASAGTLDKGQHMIYFKSRVLMGGTGAGFTGLKASAPGDPRNWDTSASGGAWLVNLDPSDGVPITALAGYGNYLLVFKQNKIYLVYDLDTGANRQINSPVGCISPRTVVTTPYGVLFLANDGHVYITDGTKIDKLTDIVGEPSNEDLRASTTACFGPRVGSVLGSNGMTAGMPNAVFYDDKYYISNIGTAAGTAATFMYDFETKAWWKYSNNMNQMAVQTFSNSTSSWLFGGANLASPSPSFQRMYNKFSNSATGTWQDAGANYNAYYTTPFISPQGKGMNPNLRRRFHAWRGYYSGSSDFQYALDQLNTFSPTFTTLGTLASGTLNLGSPEQYTFYSLGVGNSIRVKVTSTNANAWEMYPFQVYTQPRTD